MINVILVHILPSQTQKADCFLFLMARLQSEVDELILDLIQHQESNLLFHPHLPPRGE